jgi:hypothetical protein
MKSGDAVTIFCAGCRVDGTVIMASPNGASLMLGFESILDGHVGMMPVLRGDDGVYRSIITGSEVRVVPR